MEKFFIVLLLSFVGLNGLMSQSENTALLCVDGVDNDNDGLLDCDDPDCDLFTSMGCSTCFNDSQSFADQVIDYSPECLAFLSPTLINPIDALGVPDHDVSVNSPFGIGRVTLGSGGSLTLGFVDNLITNSGNNDPDVWVFEVGIDVEGTFLSFRPFDANTINILQLANIPDADNDGFYEFGAIGGATSSLDLDAVVPSLNFGDIKFDAIKLVDDADIPCGAESSGADIDSVCALSSIATEICDNNMDDDNDGLIDCDDPDLQNTCCCIEAKELDLGSDISICQGESVVIDAGTDFISYLWQDGSMGQTYTAELSELVKVEAIDSCDNIVSDSIFVSVSVMDTTRVNLSGCTGDTLIYRGFEYTDAGTFSIIETVQPCDIITILTVEFFNSVSVDISESLCPGETLEVNGEIYDDLGMYQQVLSTSSGCDSIINISISAFPDALGELSFTICNGEEITVNQENYNSSGIYTQSLTASSGCDSLLRIEIMELPDASALVSFSICSGEEIEVNQETYSLTGTYTQNLVATSGCDSVLTIELSLSDELLEINFDDCNAVISTNENGDYTEFVTIEKVSLSCGSYIASNMYRRNPLINRHSCTPGVDDSIALCISSLDSCDYDPGNDKSLVLELEFDPVSGESILFTCLQFYEKAPEMFEWINGSFGLNDYPLLYGLRISKDGVLVYEEAEINTNRDWTLQKYSFSDIPEFTVSEKANFVIEILPYCLVGNDGLASAWDIDQLTVSTGCVSGMSREIAGTIKDLNGNAVQGVNISSYSETTLKEQIQSTNESGNYAFPRLAMYQDYSIAGEKNDDYLNGVTTLDLVMIQRHILGMKAFDSPYNIIAADINDDHKISAIDLLELRKLILGVYVSLPDNDSWRFVGDNLEYADVLNPFPFLEQKYIESLDRNYEDQDFVGVKIGDVNNSVKTNFKNNDRLDTRSPLKLGFSVEDKELKSGDRFSVNFASESQVELLAFQFTLEHQGAELIDAKGMSLGKDQFVYNNYSENNTTFLWSDVDGENLAKDELLFTLDFIATRSGKISDLLVISSKVTNAASYFVDETLGGISFNFGADHQSENRFQLFQNSPNPFSDQTTINFYIPESASASLTIYDIIGNVIYKIKDDYPAGYNQIELHKDDLINGGRILYYQLESGINVATRKMIEIE